MGHDGAHWDVCEPGGLCFRVFLVYKEATLDTVRAEASKLDFEGTGSTRCGRHEKEKSWVDCRWWSALSICCV